MPGQTYYPNLLALGTTNKAGSKDKRKRKADNISKTGKAKKEKAAKPKKEKKDPQKEASECVDSKTANAEKEIEFAEKQEKIYQDARHAYINVQYAQDELEGREIYAQYY